MWVASMLINGLSAAYCCVIGYIQMRDVAVANARSQPPCESSSRPCKSDYYVRIDEDEPASQVAASTFTSSSSGGDPTHAYYRQHLHPANYRRTLYQADGTPRFWGAHIHHPTQAAAALTNR
jgi:hypothetical protein